MFSRKMDKLWIQILDSPGILSKSSADRIREVSDYLEKWLNERGLSKITMPIVNSPIESTKTSEFTYILASTTTREEDLV